MIAACGMSSTAINPLWSAADPVDRVDHPGRGGDASGVRGIEHRVRNMCIELDTRIPFDHTVDADMVVGWVIPVRCSSGSETIDALHGDQRNSIADTLDREPGRRHLAGPHRRHFAFDPMIGVPRFGALTNLVEFHAQLLGEIADRTTPQGRDDTGQDSIGVSSSGVIPKPIDLPVNS